MLCDIITSETAFDEQAMASHVPFNSPATANLTAANLTATVAAFPTAGHDHARCLHTALGRAQMAFEAKGLKLTELRRRVFVEIAGSHHAVGAYDVLERLAKTGDRLAPISVYRAIDALLAVGCVHRLESRNAYFACHTTAQHTRKPVVLACGTCGHVAEMAGDDVLDALDRLLASHQFTAHQTVIEIAGTCAGCQQDGIP
jgi:Fur family transcriptional regulator, zinc uptake regulator